MTGELNPVLIAIWAFLGMLALAGIVRAAASEGRKFAAMNKQSSWIRLRIATIPIALLAAITVVLPARSISGMEALAAFYGLLIMAGPLVYFGAHIVVGRWLRPRLEVRESMRVGITGLLMALIPAFLAQFLNPWVHRLAHGARAGRLAMADARPTPFRFVEQHRFALADLGEVWTERWQAPPGLVIDHVERQVDGAYVRVDSGGGSTLCRDGQDFHVFWPASQPAPRWRMYWKSPEGIVRSDWMSVPPLRQAEDFNPRWLADGVALPVRVPRDMVALGRRWSDGRESFHGLDDVLPRHSGRGICLPLELRAVPGAESQPPFTAVSISLWRRETQQMLRAVYRRPGMDESEPAGEPAPMP